MRLRHVLKVLARSGSLSFTRHAAQETQSTSLAKLRWHGRDVFYRPGTSDPLVLYQVLLKTGLKAEYYVPAKLEPEVIVDIGSSIGPSILYFHERFPRAKIFGFEPHPETFGVLQRNVAGLPGVSVFNYGLGDTDDTITAPVPGINFSRFSTQPGVPDDPTMTGFAECEIRHAGRCFESLGISRMDLLKIDCEGSEGAIFRSLPPEMLQRCQWIVGEMHDASGFEILAQLARDFDLDVKKRMFSDKFRFHASNVASAPALRGTFDRHALQA